MILNPADQNAVSPAISGHRVAFTHRRGWTNVVLMELPPPKSKVVGSIAYTPSIDGDLVAFSSTKHRWGGWTAKLAPKTSWIGDIMAYEIGGIDLAFAVTHNDKANQNNPDVSGATIVWDEGRAAGGWTNTGIYKRNIDLDADPVRICTHPGEIAKNPTISGDIIV